MKNKVCIIIPYFGKFPNTMEAFLLSCKKNSEFQWLIFTDDKIEDIPNNVKVIYCSLSDIKRKIEKKMGFSVSLAAPYKLCDYRPAYGVIFAEYLEHYDFWGYGDIDLVYGNLSRFITDKLLDQYDKIYPCGHLSIVRNKEEINNAFLYNDSITLNYKQVFTNDKSFIFDEYLGINEKLINLGKKVYGKFDFADMDVVYKRFRTSDRHTIKVVFPLYLYKSNFPQNYKKQTFYHCERGAFRTYVTRRGNIEKEELVYIHYRHKIDSNIRISNDTSFYITNKGFVEKAKDVTIEDIRKLNPYPGILQEWKEFFVFMKRQTIYKLGSNRKLRNVVRCLKGKDRI